MIKATEYRDDYLKSDKIIEIGILLYGCEVWPIYYDTFNFHEDCLEQRIDYTPIRIAKKGSSLMTDCTSKDVYNSPLIKWIESFGDNYGILLSTNCSRSAEVCQSLREVKHQILQILEYRETERQRKQLEKQERELQKKLRETIRFKSDPRCALLKNYD